jgi:hypothetical protein
MAMSTLYAARTSGRQGGRWGGRWGVEGPNSRCKEEIKVNPDIEKREAK